MRRLSIFACAIGLLLKQSAMSQPAFSPQGEIRVSRQPSAEQSELAIGDDGAFWIAWGNSSQWYHPDGTQDGPIVGSPYDGCLPLSLAGGRWAKITKRDLPNPGSFPFCFRSQFRFWLNDRGTESDSSDLLFERFWWQDLDNNFGHKYAFNIRGCRIDSSLFTVTNTFEVFRYNSGPQAQIYEGAVVRWTPSTHHTSTVTKSGYWFSWAAASLEFYGIQNHVISRPFNHAFAYFARLYEGNSNAPRYLRIFRLYDAQGSPLTAIATIDTVPSGQTNTSERVVLRSDRVIVLQRDPAANALLIEQFDFLGKPVVSPIRRALNLKGRESLWGYSIPVLRNYEYEVADLKNDRMIIVWTDHTPQAMDVYAGIMDADFDFVSPPKRLNSDTTGSQYGINLAVKGDTAIVCWTDERSGEPHVYLRRFTSGQVTAAEGVEMTKEFRLDQNYPNPISTSATIRFTLPTRQHATLRVYDLMGRMVRVLFEGEAGPGAKETVFRPENLPSGVYLCELRGESGISRRKLILQH